MPSEPRHVSPDPPDLDLSGRKPLLLPRCPLVPGVRQSGRPGRGGSRGVCESGDARRRVPRTYTLPRPAKRRAAVAREHSVHFISDYRFLNIIKSLACSGGSVSQSVGSYFSTHLQKTKGDSDRQTDRRAGEVRGRQRADTQGNTLSHTQRKVPEKRGPAMRGGRHRRSSNIQKKKATKTKLGRGQRGEGGR